MKAFLLILLGGFSAAIGSTQSEEPFQAISTPLLSSVSAAGGSFEPAFSADGRYLLFLSRAGNLVGNDDGVPFADVFVRDLAANQTILVSVNRSGFGGGNGNSSCPSISGDGRLVAFASAADNLVDQDNNQGPDVFVRDLVSGTTRLASLDAAGLASGLGQIEIVLPDGTRYPRAPLPIHPAISADGRWVVFESPATNLVNLPDENNALDVFARDLHSNSTLLVSVNHTGTAAANGPSAWPSLSADGRIVAFVSSAIGLVPDVTNTLEAIYVRELPSGPTMRVSQEAESYFANPPHLASPVVSAQGNVVLYTATGPGESAVWLFHHDLQSHETAVVTRNLLAGSVPVVSWDGRFVAFATDADELAWDDNQVFRWDATSHQSQPVSVDPFGAVRGPAWSPAISPDGEQVAFVSSGPLTELATTGLYQVFVRDMARQITRLVSIRPDGLPSQSQHDAAVPTISPDGRRVGFASRADDLVEGDLNLASDIFLFDQPTGAISLATGADQERPAGSGAAASLVADRHGGSLPFGGPASRQCVSANGRWAVFLSFDPYLAGGPAHRFLQAYVRDLFTGGITPIRGAGPVLDPALSAEGRYAVYSVADPVSPGTKAQVYWRDLVTGSEELVSVRDDGAGPADRLSTDPSITADGAKVVFVSNQQIYVRDMVAQTNRLITWSQEWGRPGNGASYSPVLTPDERWVVFVSFASDLVPHQYSGSGARLYAHDLQMNTTHLVSLDGEGNLVGCYSGYGWGCVSANSGVVAFPGAGLYVHDLPAQTTLVVTTNWALYPRLNADGTLIAYETRFSPQIYLQNLVNGETELLSVNYLGTDPGDGPSTSPVLSPDGRQVIFLSQATDLIPDDHNNRADIFLRDRVSGTTLLLTPGDNPSGLPNPFSRLTLGADGRTVLFRSYAGGLVPGDYADTGNVFAFRWGADDSDGDGLDDSWELAFFDTLDRDGSGDFDRDGSTDGAEYLAGTSPTEDESVLQVLTLNCLDRGGTVLVWTAHPGRTYRVQYKSRVDETGWTDLLGTVTAVSSTATLYDASAAGTRGRFYRVMLGP